ncbi:MAG: hypothetical protein L6428_09820 [Candidatus Aminicenantes bacterium]|nr:hypothetical protein [Acidobacteriota bacterium]MCG2811741.1 hypothetical protein [Candidatus Aminicenantes bacterium]
MKFFGASKISREELAEAIRAMAEEELVFANRLIIERLKLLSQARSTRLLSGFSVDDRVRFQGPDGDVKLG